MGTKISSLPAAGTLTGTEIVVMDQAGNTVTAPSGNMGIWVRTAAEIAAGVTPTNYAYQPGDIRRYGGACNAGNGDTPDNAAIQSAYNALPAEGGEIFIPFPSYVDSSSVIWFGGNGTALKPCRITGAAIVGESYTASATAPVCGIGIVGSLGAPISYSSTIAAGTNSFTLTNTFSTNDVILLSNFPTDSGGSDAYTSATPNMFGVSALNYSNTSTSNLRQTRRKELLTVLVANSTTVTTNQATAYAYGSTQGLQFQLVNTAGPVIFECDLTNIQLFFNYSIGCEVRGRLTNSAVASACCYGHKISPVLFDAGQYDCRVDNYDGCRNFNLTGNYIGGVSTGDNGVVKVDGCVEFNIDVRVDGAGTNYHGVMTDENFGQNPSGYTDLPCLNYTIRAICDGLAGNDIFVTCDPYSAANGNACVDAGNTLGQIYLKGASNVTILGSPAKLRLDGCTGADLVDNRLTYFFESTVTNPRDSSQTQANSDLRGLWQAFTPTVTGSSTAGTGTYSVQFGQYIRKGNLVTGNLTVTWSAHTGTGNIQAVLPFECDSGSQPFPAVVGACYGGSGSTLLGQSLVATVIAGQSYAELYVPATLAPIEIAPSTTQSVNLGFQYYINNSAGA